MRDLQMLSTVRPDEISILSQSLSQKNLPVLGALRFFGARKGITLADLVTCVGSATEQIRARKLLEDSKPYTDILDFVGYETIPDPVFFSLRRSDARRLVSIFQTSKRNPSIRERIRQYLTDKCRFDKGWIDEVNLLVLEGGGVWL